jgi:hypothetical protein
MTEVASRAHRILKPLTAYRDVLENKNWPAGAPAGPTLDDTEYHLGLYINDSINFLDSILFTNCGLYIFNGQVWTRVLYSEIARVISPNGKSEIAGLSILRRDGNEFFLPVRGITANRFYDAFEILRFLDRVRADAAKLD